MFWQLGEQAASVLHVNTIGSQADSMAAVSTAYEQWVNRVMNWVRRKGTKVWGLERDTVRPDLDIQLSFVNTVYALPGALRELETGASGR
jgi:hypothetical protein